MTDCFIVANIACLYKKMASNKNACHSAIIYYLMPGKATDNLTRVKITLYFEPVLS